VIISALLALSIAGADSPPAAAPAAAKPAGNDADIQQQQQANSDEGSTGKTLQERIRAVSRRVFLKRQRFEIEPQFGFTTNDALEQDWSFGARASYHFNEELAIDFGGAYAPLNLPQDNVRIADGNNNALNGVVVTKQYGYADAGVTFSPFYGKLALLAEEVVHFDGFLSGGLGATFSNEPGNVHPAIEVGVGTRVFLTHWLTARADLRNYSYVVANGNAPLQFPNSLLLTFGLGVHFPLEFDYSSEVIGGKG
jgi:outer membrane beta-barrel protein